MFSAVPTIDKRPKEPDEIKVNIVMENQYLKGEQSGNAIHCNTQIKSLNLHEIEVYDLSLLFQGETIEEQADCIVPLKPPSKPPDNIENDGETTDCAQAAAVLSVTTGGFPPQVGYLEVGADLISQNALPESDDTTEPAPQPKPPFQTNMFTDNGAKQFELPLCEKSETILIEPPAKPPFETCLADAELQIRSILNTSSPRSPAIPQHENFNKMSLHSQTRDTCLTQDDDIIKLHNAHFFLDSQQRSTSIIQGCKSYNEKDLLDLVVGENDASCCKDQNSSCPDASWESFCRPEMSWKITVLSDEMSRCRRDEMSQCCRDEISLFCRDEMSRCLQDELSRCCRDKTSRGRCRDKISRSCAVDKLERGL